MNSTLTTKPSAHIVYTAECQRSFSTQYLYVSLMLLDLQISFMQLVTQLRYLIVVFSQQSRLFSLPCF